MKMIPHQILLDIDKLLKLPGRHDRAHLAAHIRNELRKLPEFDSDSESQFLLGYVTFIDFRRRGNPGLQKLCHDALSRALDIDPCHARAWLYLGHLELESGDYSSAGVSFKKASHLMDDMYLKLKAAEMLVVTKIRAVDIEGALQEFENYARMAEQAEPEDVWPSELALVLKALGAVDEKSLFVDLARRVDRAGQHEDWLTKIILGPSGETSP